MKKKNLTLILIILVVSLLGGCGQKEQNNYDNITEYNAFINTINPILENIKATTNSINELDYNDENAFNSLKEYLTQLENQYLNLSQTVPPHEYNSLSDITKEAYEYIKDANNYIEDAFTQDPIGEKYIEAAIECYKRANKRLKYIIQIIYE